MARAVRTVSIAVWDYLDHLSRNGALWSYKGYRSKLIRFEEALGASDVRSLDRPTLFEYLYGRRGATKGCEYRNAAQHATAIQNVIDFAVNRGWRDPLKVPTPKDAGLRKPDERDWTRYSADEMLLLQEGMPCPRSRIIVAVITNTAMRIDDVFDIQNRYVRSQTGDLRARIKKSKMWDTKPITLDLEDEIRRYRQWYTEACGVTDKDDVYFIPGSKRNGDWIRKLPDGTVAGYDPDPSRRVSYNWAYTRLKGALETQGLFYDKGEAWHMLRRSVARLYFDTMAGQGYDLALRMTQALLNHKEVSTTEKYLGLAVETAKRDQSLKGQAFLTRGRDGVVDLHRERGRQGI
ncbi:tyrosine-type recombinase/integrase [Streptomyces sp. NPDC058471]|uniref:tyrosine-type recombinase/integrase n=1 Tax=Streptomyces sp. NPDC058471 TaxID=3346516 RepID=UPI0036524A4F